MTILDFKNEDGSFDWTAYGAAKKAEKEERKKSGKECYQCGAYIIFGGKGYRELCYDCRLLRDDTSETTSDNYIRCPKCKGLSLVHDGDHYDLYEEGEHDITCLDCGHEYQIETSVTYSFQSPAVLGETEREEGEQV